MNPSKCRFCGSETAPHLHSTQDPDITPPKAYWVCCRQSSLGCGACGPVKDSEEVAIKTWNIVLPVRPRYKHLKTGNIYTVVGVAINATNAQDDQAMVLYSREGDCITYAREQDEFYEKFERLTE